MITLAVDTVLFAGPEDASEEARAYVSGYGLGKEDVKLVLRGDILCVVAKKEIVLGSEGN
jgi:hypothetical protein